LLAGGRLSQAELARRLGVSRARISQVLRLLDLAPETKDVIARLGDPLPSHILGERALRSLHKLPAEQQTSAVRNLIAGVRLRFNRSVG
ncbi:MAG: hypothetical protein ACYC4L_01580, partial [Chloroflexota bacterium]